MISKLKLIKNLIKVTGNMKSFEQPPNVLKVLKIRLSK